MWQEILLIYFSISQHSTSGQAFAQKNNEVTFVKKKTCANVELSPGMQYLIMGKEALKINIGYSFR